MTTDFEAAARELLDGRVQAVRELAQTRAAVERAEAELVEAQREDAKAWAAAEKAGWTAAELVKVGLSRPKTRAPGRPRKRVGTSTPPPAGAGQSPNSESHHS